jgi:hypothetical protein
MELTIKLSNTVVKDLRDKFGDEKYKWVVHIEKFLDRKAAEMYNWGGRPDCYNCGEPIDPDAGYPGQQNGLGDWHHIDCDGVFPEDEME